MSGRSRSQRSITAATDNQGNTYAVTKLISTKYHLSDSVNGIVGDSEAGLHLLGLALGFQGTQ